jgi:hypothetical protein
MGLGACCGLIKYLVVLVNLIFWVSARPTPGHSLSRHSIGSEEFLSYQSRFSVFANNEVSTKKKIDNPNAKCCEKGEFYTHTHTGEKLGRKKHALTL